MRLGVAGMMPGKLDQIDERVLRTITDLGFTGVSIHLANAPHSIDQALCEQVRALLAGCGVALVQFWGSYASLISPDDRVRAESIAALEPIFRLGGWLGAHSIGVRPTSLNPRGVWWHDRNNYLPATEDRLVDSLKQIAVLADRFGLPVTLECHNTTTLRSPAVVRRIVERVGSPWIKVTLDAVNFVRDFDTAADTTALISEIFDELAPYLFCAHLKDVYIEDRHVIHISETIPGDGIFDFDTLLTRFEALLPDGFALIEHLPDSQVPQAARFVRATIDRLQLDLKP